MYGNSYLTYDLQGTGGRIKAIPEDFVVHEIPLYPALGVGEHVYVEIEKRGMTTFEAIERIMRALRVPDRAIGYAGLKDSRAVTRQTISIHGADPRAVERMKVPGMKVLSVGIHSNKLRPGHLKGNRFRIRIRDVEEGALERCERILDHLAGRGVPNAFGVQRFGSRRDAHHIGRALCLGDAKAVVDRIVGNPSPYEHNRVVVAARELYEEGDLEGALRRFPSIYKTERALLRGVLGSGGNYEDAVKGIAKKMRRLYLAAFQSHLFNMTLWRRIADFDKLMDGDLAYKHANGAVFPVGAQPVEHESPVEPEEPVEPVDPAALEARLAAFDISPSGPLHGYKMLRPMGRPRFIEDEVLRDEGFEPETLMTPFRNARLKGERRSLRVPVREPSVEEGENEDGEASLLVSFMLPRGSYATIVLREIMKAGDDAVVMESDTTT